MTLGRTKKKHIFEVWPKQTKDRKHFNFQLNLCKDADLIASVAVIELAVPGPSVCVAWRVPWRWPRPLCCGGPSKAVFFSAGKKYVTNLSFLSSNCWRKQKRFQSSNLTSLQHFSGMQSFEFHKYLFHFGIWQQTPLHLAQSSRAMKMALSSNGIWTPWAFWWQALWSEQAGLFAWNPSIKQVPRKRP